ncbi:MAG: GHKL domain-containing protein [Lachnospiraceae bacterium]|nr:GHKL domain-containing protein [Lachnospiraceae bacterium]
MGAVLVSLLSTLAHVPSLILRYVPFKEHIDKKQKKLLLIIYSVSLFLDFILCMAMETRCGMSISFYKINLLVFCVFMAIVNILVVKGYTREHLFTSGLVAVIVLMLFTLSVFLTDKIGYDTISHGIVITNIFLLVAFSTLYVPIKKLMKRTVTPFLNIEGNDYWKTTWFIPIAMFFASLFSLPVDDYVSTVMQVISKFLIGIATLFICRNIAKDYQRMKERERLGQQIKLQKQYYDALTEKVKDEREARHNYKHHIAAIRGFLDSGNIDGLSAYCESLEQTRSKSMVIPYTGNAAADGVLYYYCTLAEKEKIQIEVTCSLNALTLSDLELCSLLGNALDNAVTACKNYDGKRFIRIATEMDGEMLILTVDNSFDGVLHMDHQKILSKKRDNEEGIGIASMRQICERHGGTCSFKADGNNFEASFLLHK